MATKEINEILIQDSEGLGLGFLCNQQFSCYCDVALYCLLVNRIPYIETQILESSKHHILYPTKPNLYLIIDYIQKELNRIVRAIRGGKATNVNRFRVLLSYYLIIKMSYQIMEVERSQRWSIYRQNMQNTMAIFEAQTPETREKMMAEMFEEMRILDSHDAKDISLKILGVHQKYHINMLFTDQQLAPVDLYAILIEIFELDDVVKYQTIFECREKMTTIVRTGKRNHSSTILLTLSGQDLDQPTPLDVLMSNAEIPVTLDVKDIIGVDRDHCQNLYAHHIYTSAPIMIIYVQKSEEGSRQPIYPSNTIPVTERQLHLNAMIIHTGELSAGHYQAYINYQNRWYLYDDSSPNAQLKLVSTENKVETIPNYEVMCQNTIYYLYV